jgi:(2Fe-2S) ferredoxin
LFYKNHIFICTNVKNEGKCCGNEPISSELIKELKTLVKTSNLTGKGGIRISSSGCMGRCEEGPIAVIYPEGQWFKIKDSQEREKIHNFIKCKKVL